MRRGERRPITYFLCPPPWAAESEIGHADSSDTISSDDYLDLLFDVGEDAPDWLLRQIVAMTQRTTESLTRWGAHFAAVVETRKREVDALVEGARRAGSLPREEER